MKICFLLLDEIILLLLLLFFMQSSIMLIMFSIIEREKIDRFNRCVCISVFFFDYYQQSIDWLNIQIDESVRLNFVCFTLFFSCFMFVVLIIFSLLMIIINSQSYPMYPINQKKIDLNKNKTKMCMNHMYTHINIHTHKTPNFYVHFLLWSILFLFLF